MASMAFDLKQHPKKMLEGEVKQVQRCFFTDSYTRIAHDRTPKMQLKKEAVVISKKHLSIYIYTICNRIWMFRLQDFRYKCSILTTFAPSIGTGHSVGSLGGFKVKQKQFARQCWLLVYISLSKYGLNASTQEVAYFLVFGEHHLDVPPCAEDLAWFASFARTAALNDTGHKLFWTSGHGSLSACFCILALPFDTSCQWIWGCLFEIEHARFFQDRWFTSCS